MKEILTGKIAQDFCNKLLAEGEDFYKNKKKGNDQKGYFPETLEDNSKVVYTAFDNRTNDCWVEQFDTPELAIAWLNDEFEFDDLEVFKRSRK